MSWSSIRLQRESYVSPSAEEQCLSVPHFKRVVNESDPRGFSFEQQSLDEMLNASTPCVSDSLAQSEVSPLPFYDEMDLLNRVAFLESRLNIDSSLVGASNPSNVSNSSSNESTE